MSTFIKRPRKFQSQKNPENFYFLHNGKVVMIDKEALSKWDNILELAVEDVQFNKMDEDGNPIEGVYQMIPKIVDYTDTDRTLELDAFDAKRAAIKATSTTLTQDKAAALALADDVA